MLPSSESAKGCGRVAHEDSVAFSCVLADVAASRMARRRSARSAATLSMRNFSRATRESATRVLCGAELYRSSRGSPPLSTANRS